MEPGPARPCISHRTGACVTKADPMNVSIRGELDAQSLEEMRCKAEEATAFLKALAHEGRLMILCHLATGEKSVSELETLIGVAQATVSQQLARLRHAGFVESRRSGKEVIYSLSDGPVLEMIGNLYDIFCAPGGPGGRG